MKRSNRLLAAACLALSSAGIGSASMIFTATSGDLGAQAEFALNGSTLTVTLTNTAPLQSGNYTNPDVLTALFFNSNTNLSQQHATAEKVIDNDGLTVVCPSSCNVDSAWEFLPLAPSPLTHQA